MAGKEWRATTNGMKAVSSCRKMSGFIRFVETVVGGGSPSAFEHGLWSGPRVGGQQLVDQGFDPGADALADGSDAVDALPRGVVEFPVLLTLAGEDRADVTATHGDDHVGDAHRVGGQHL